MTTLWSIHYSTFTSIQFWQSHLTLKYNFTSLINYKQCSNDNNDMYFINQSCTIIIISVVGTYDLYLYEFILYYIAGCKYDQILLYTYIINNNNYLLYYTNI